MFDWRKDFQGVFCFGVLYHLKNPYKAIENLFEATNETLIIETQGIKNEGYLNAKIDDFRKIEIWKSEKYHKKKFRIKDPGHKNAILQPFTNLDNRSWEEISLSTKLMLEISNMVENNNTFKSIKVEI